MFFLDFSPDKRYNNNQIKYNQIQDQNHKIVKFFAALRNEKKNNNQKIEKL